MRLNKYIASCGVCSRRDADKLIEDGKVVVNGQVASFGCQVEDGDEVLVDGKKIGIEETLVYAYYKPVGVTCTEKDEHAERTVIEDISLDKRVTYAGRLDKDSEGLLIMTNDGKLIDAMMRGANKHEKEYVVSVDKPLSDEFLSKMSKGVYLKELNTTTRPCKVKKYEDKSFNIVLTQGLNRQIRRMCDELGYKVTSLKRIRIMNIDLKKYNLSPSKYVEIKGEDLSQLYKDCGL